MRTDFRGFTLIELMMVVAIIGILAAIALPAYQDYMVRSKATEALLSAGEFKTRIAESTTVPELAANVAAVNSAFGQTKYINALTAGANGVITITMNATNVGAPGTLMLAPFVRDTSAGGTPMTLAAAVAASKSGPVDWACASDTNVVATNLGMAVAAGTFKAKFAPANCR